MKSILYLLVNEDKSSFKIGITDNLEARHARLRAVWGKFDLASSRIVFGTRRDISGLEKTLHFLLGTWQIKKEEHFDGKSEWFSIECFDKAIEIIASAASLRNLKLDDRLIIGLQNNITKKQKNGIKIKQKHQFEVVANLDGIMMHWPAYKKGTIAFMDHPSVQNNWLWTVDIGDSSVIFFMDLFRFQNSHSSIRLIQEIYFRTDHSTSIVDASISKIALSWLNEHEAYKQCYEFIATEFRCLILEKNYNASFQIEEHKMNWSNIKL